MTTVNWQNYEDVATYLLNRFSDHFGLVRVEGKQSVPGKRSDTKWTIDAKGIRQGEDAFVIIECRRHTTSKQDQEQLAALAYRIIDTGAESGIVVSPLGFQAGAAKVASAEHVVHVTLHEDSTPTEFAMQFLNKLFIGIQERCDAVDRFHAIVTRICPECGAKFPVKNNELVCTACSREEPESK
jgi:hypothetical protein